MPYLGTDCTGALLVCAEECARLVSKCSVVLGFQSKSFLFMPSMPPSLQLTAMPDRADGSGAMVGRSWRNHPTALKPKEKCPLTQLVWC